ncbi:MAG: CHAP domain-containing protein [Alphaproteobacteria bacterium]
MRGPALVALLLMLAACAGPWPRDPALSPPSLAPSSLVAPLECVPYARARSGIALRGDAWTWWAGAEGRYARSSLPREGAVLVFRRTATLPRGHVAVVTAVGADGWVHVAHANWIPGRVTADVAVIDVSPARDWSRVRVFNAATGSFGRVYETDGFILPDRVTAGI